MAPHQHCTAQTAQVQNLDNNNSVALSTLVASQAEFVLTQRLGLRTGRKQGRRGTKAPGAVDRTVDSW